MPGDADILYRCNVTWTLLGQNCLNSFFFRSKPGAPYDNIPAEMSDLHDQIRNQLLTPLRNILSQQVQLVASVLVNLNGGVFYEDPRSYVAQFGGVGSDSLPSYCAQVISWRTAFRGRRVHGRTYLPGVPKISVNGNDLEPSAQVTLDAAAGTILDHFAETSRFSYPFLVVYSRKNGVTTDPGPPPALVYSPLAGIPVTRYVIDATVFTQRHRLEGRGI